MNLKFSKLSYPLGVSVSGVDISERIADEIFREIYRAFLAHCVLLFRGQSTTREQFIAFSRRFGELGKSRKALSDYPEISTVVNEPKTDGSPVDTHFNGSDWHSDRSFRLDPISISLLKAVEVPEVGGDTQFANLYLAYETLTERMKKLIDGLEGVHMQEEKFLDHSTPERLLASRRSMTVAHPLVKVHPETGRKSLFLGDKCVLIAGMTRDESKSLLDFLCSHAKRPQFVYCHQWQEDDLLIWDNRCTNHNALGNYDRRNQRRYMEKTYVPGTTTGYLYDDPTQTRNITSGVANFG